jgi:hypothetical protein
MAVFIVPRAIQHMYIQKVSDTLPLKQVLIYHNAT